MFSQMSQDDTVRNMMRIESWKKCRLNTIFFIWDFYWAKIVLVLQKKVCLASHNNHPTSLASSWDISFLKSLVQQDPKGSNKVAHHLILDVYVSPNRKYVNLSILYYITDFSFFMSQDDAYFVLPNEQSQAKIFAENHVGNHNVPRWQNMHYCMFIAQYALKLDTSMCSNIAI